MTQEKSIVKKHPNFWWYPKHPKMWWLPDRRYTPVVRQAIMKLIRHWNGRYHVWARAEHYVRAYKCAKPCRKDWMETNGKLVDFCFDPTKTQWWKLVVDDYIYY